MAKVALRPIEDADLDALFDQERDPESVWMAAFTPKDPGDRAAFDAHMAKVRASPDVNNFAVTLDGRLVGSAASFVIEGDTEITYWIDRSLWGRGSPAGRSPCCSNRLPSGLCSPASRATTCGRWQC